MKERLNWTPQEMRKCLPQIQDWLLWTDYAACSAKKWRHMGEARLS